ESQDLDCFIYSEVAAEVASITLSRTSRDGLYAFVDVGAGTVDASVFRLHRQPQSDRAHIEYATEVLQSGSTYVEAKAVTWLSKNELIAFTQNTRGNGAKEDSEKSRLREHLKKLKESKGKGVTKHESIKMEDLRRALIEASKVVHKKVALELIEVFRNAYFK